MMDTNEELNGDYADLVYTGAPDECSQHWPTKTKDCTICPCEDCENTCHIYIKAYGHCSCRCHSRDTSISRPRLIEDLYRAIQPNYIGWEDQYKAILNALNIDMDLPLAAFQRHGDDIPDLSFTSTERR